MKSLSEVKRFESVQRTQFVGAPEYGRRCQESAARKGPCPEGEATGGPSRPLGRACKNCVRARCARRRAKGEEVGARATRSRRARGRGTCAGRSRKDCIGDTRKGCCRESGTRSGSRSYTQSRARRALCRQ